LLQSAIPSAIVTGHFKTGDRIKVTAENGQLSFQRQK
jgi:hypothetical protein